LRGFLNMGVQESQKMAKKPKKERFIPNIISFING
jgi:hypothetical protein